ncbi:hypothetical protein [Pontixanthobacter sp.]|uniref:hypothetical protein n=1 Tax=Pontixanthobacter sp. TaxID=2792078 RepID=UPI003C7E294A
MVTALGAAIAVAFALPSAGLALGGNALSLMPPEITGLGTFTPAGVDPLLAQRVQKTMRDKGLNLGFTPAKSVSAGNRTVTVAIRIDDETAQAISVRPAVSSARGNAVPRAIAVAPTRYNLGVARGYQGFTTQLGGPDKPSMSGAIRSSAIGDISMPDLSDFKPVTGTAERKPNRFQPRIALEAEEKTGRAPRTLDALGEQSVDVGGAYRVTKNLDVTAGVRLSQDRDRLDPLTDSVQDSQAVYVGTQFRF